MASELDDDDDDDDLLSVCFYMTCLSDYMFILKMAN